MNRPFGLFILLAAAASASAQVTLSSMQGGIATLAGSAYNYGPVALGSSASAVFRLTNTGAEGVYLTGLALNGPTSPPPADTPEFAVACAQSPDLCAAQPLQQLPILIGPGGTLDFTVQFQPFELGSPSANMTIAAGNTISIILLGNAVPGLTVLVNNQPLADGQAVTFGSVQMGASQTIVLTLANQTNTLLAVPAIPPIAGDFSLAGIALSATSVPANSSVELDVIFTPSATGTRQGTLTIGLSTYPLQGAGLASSPPVFPTPSLQLTLATPASAQQGTIAVNLSSTSVSSGTGTVTLAFQPAAGLSDDPTITFANGTRSETFAVALGASAGQFGAEQTVSFATGTTAGTITFTVSLGTNTAQANVAIPAAEIGVDAAVAARNVACDLALVYCAATNIQLQINGWDNTRSTSEIVFTFLDSSGSAIAPGAISVSAATAFQQYFAGSDLGGVFGLSALFPITGDSTQVVAAQVQITNSVGATQTSTITF
jgi:hypothetical protein